MATATLKAEFMPGDSIEGAFEESIRLSKLLDCWIEFNFNGVLCMSNKNGNVERGVNAYRNELKKKDGQMLAFS